MEESGSVHLTNLSGSRRPINLRFLRIRNTNKQTLRRKVVADSAQTKPDPKGIPKGQKNDRFTDRDEFTCSLIEILPDYSDAKSWCKSQKKIVLPFEYSNTAWYAFLKISPLVLYRNCSFIHSAVLKWLTLLMSKKSILWLRILILEGRKEEKNLHFSELSGELGFSMKV